jgi:hypothetical protein
MIVTSNAGRTRSYNVYVPSGYADIVVRAPAALHDFVENGE